MVIPTRKRFERPGKKHPFDFGNPKTKGAVNFS
jgi:hypothetical protein